VTGLLLLLWGDVEIALNIFLEIIRFAILNFNQVLLTGGRLLNTSLLTTPILTLSHSQTHWITSPLPILDAGLLHLTGNR